MTGKRDAARLNAAISKAILALSPPDNLSVSEWADKHRRLSSEASAEVGPWRTSRTPYLKEIMDSFSDPKVHHIVLVASSQVGKTEAELNMIGSTIHQDPGSILFIHPTRDGAKEFSRLRIAPMIRDTKVLKSKISDPKSRDSGNTILQKTYPGGILTLCGSQEAPALASKPIRIVIGDERDRWSRSAGTEGDPWELALARQITFYNRKSVEVSTPTIKGDSAIAKAYAKGTRERWHSRCPHCGEYSEITFSNIRFDHDTIGEGDEKTIIVSNIFYICPKCGGVSLEGEMKRAPAKWVAENQTAYTEHGRRSFWLTSWVSPWASWESTIVKYLEALDDPEALKVVYNTRFGQLWENRTGLADEKTILARREDYGAELPDGVLFLTMGVDTQDDRLEFEVVGHGHFGETWGIKKGIIIGRPDTRAVWDELDGEIDRVYRFANGVGLRVSTTFIDEGGHFTYDVRQRCLERQGRHVFAIKGRGGPDIPYTNPPKPQKIIVNGKAVGKCYVFMIGVDAGKALIMSSLLVKEPGQPKYCHFPKRDDYGADYFRGLISEQLVYKPKSKTRYQWEKIQGHERNEPLDCRNYAMAAAHALSPDLDVLEARLREKAGQPPVSRDVPTKSTPPKAARKAPPKKAKNIYYDEW